MKKINRHGIIAAKMSCYNYNENLRYFCIEALEDGLQANLSVNTCEYSLDGNTWNSLSAATNTPTVNTGEKIYFRGNLIPKIIEGIGTFTISKKCNLKGNIMSLLYGDDFEGQTNLTGKTYVFYRLFYNCKNILDVSELILPSTTLADSCYCRMFENCTRLTSSPELPATTLAYSCYESMFQGCTRLTKAPELPATSLSKWCYKAMFYNSGLTTAPELPATTLANSCYYYMFSGCSNLNYIKMLATDISASSCLNNWVNGVANTGTFVKHPDMTSLPLGTSGIPNGWIVEDYVETNLITFTIGGTEYYAEEGMTWYQWCNSKYNTDGYIACGEEGHIINIDETQYICNSNYYLILSDETIKLNYAYVLNEFEKNIITFTFNILSTITEHQAEEGMTWEEWVNSEYNTCGVYIMSNGKINVPGNGFEYIYNSTTSEYDGVYKTDIIQNNHQYNGFGGSSGD